MLRKKRRHSPEFHKFECFTFPGQKHFYGPKGTENYVLMALLIMWEKI